MLTQKDFATTKDFLKCKNFTSSSPSNIAANAVPQLYFNINYGERGKGE